MKKKQSSYYPVFLSIAGKKCVVVGGGQVALRKVKSLLDYGASVEVISPSICSELNELSESGKIHALNANYRVGDLGGAWIAIAATDNNKINLEVAKEAEDTGVLVNVVDDPDNSDFILPSYLRRGDVTIAISTSGRSPALARKVRTMLEKEFGDEYAALALLIDEVRTEVKSNEIDINGDVWQRALDIDSMIDLLRKGDKEKARSLLLDNLRKQQT